jgi:hypothetical protein
MVASNATTHAVSNALGPNLPGKVNPQVGATAAKRILTLPTSRLNKLEKQLKKSDLPENV